MAAMSKIGVTDILSDIFDTIRLRGTLYFRTAYSPPWAIAVPPYKQAARFHLLVQGRCHIALEDGREAELSAGDLVMIPAGRGHVMGDQKGRPPSHLDDLVERAGFNGKGAFVVGEGDPAAATQMVCGHLSFMEGADHPLLRALPQLIVLRPADREKAPILDDTLRLAARRAFTEEPGAAATIARLSEIFFIEALRAALPYHPELARIVEAMKDPQIGRVLEQIHDSPAQRWTVETLALIAGMSRSRFSERFTDAIGLAPMAYVTEWRLQKALARLATHTLSVKEVAAESGYQSAAAFTRAFSARFGYPPTEAAA